MYEEEFAPRLIELRTQKGVSARDMSLSIGQCESYIHSIESGKALPSMSAFFFICDYLKITPSEFFNTKAHNPGKLRQAMHLLESLSSNEFNNIVAVIGDLAKK